MINNNLDQTLEKIKHLAKGVIAEEAPLVDSKALWPEKSLRALLDQGFGGLVSPLEMGGAGQGLYGLVKVCEIISQQCASTSMCFGMHLVATAVLSAKSTDEQKKKFIEPIIAGKCLASLALSEPGSGAHFYYPETEATTIPGGGYRINGKKTFVTNGSRADLYVISTVAVEPDALPNEFSCFAIEGDAQGLQWGPHWKGLGMRGNSSTSLELKNVIVSPENLLGEKGDQLWYIFNVVAPYFLMAMSGTYLGIAQAAYNQAVNHIKSRTYSHSGTSLSNVAVVQHKLGTLWANLESTRGLIYNAALQGDHGKETAIPFLLASKAEVAHCAVSLVNEAMTLMGGIGFRENSKMDVLLRDARASHVMSPTTDLLYTWIGRALLEQPILGD